MAKGKKNNKAKIQTFIDRDDVSIVANIEQNCILTTEDKIKILYNEYNEARKYSGEFWTFLSLFLALFTTVLTCDFKPFWVFSESVVEATYVFATATTLALTLVSLVKWIINHKKLSFEYFITQIRGNDCND